jgi:radical SAM superfamily enzyme YgiQ (UPF0313 family)
MPESLVLINPWIYDFAAYDLWSKPLGLLYLAGFLRKCGFTVRLIDCMDAHYPGLLDDPAFRSPARRAFGTGKFFREEVPKPPQLRFVERPYSRYGIPQHLLEEALKQLQEPAAFLVTSLMTYWYPGVMAVIQMIRKIHPGVPVILGGIYARLCPEHASSYSGATVVSPEDDPGTILDILENFSIFAPEHPGTANGLPYPAFDLLGGMDYVCLMTSTGCHYRCRYCASPYLRPSMTRRSPHEVVEEILHWHKNFRIRDFAFYDDALLISSQTHMGPILEETVQNRLPIRFHAPNALHVGEITVRTARLLKRSGFRTIRLGLETSDPELHKTLDKKVSEGDFEEAVQNLFEAGFRGNEIGAYILAGLPGQTAGSVLETVDLVARAGVTPFLAEYSPIPHTGLWEEAVRASSLDLASEPLFHNNTLLPCWGPEERKAFAGLKQHVNDIRRKAASLKAG